MKRIGKWLLILLVAAVVLFALGPTEETDTTIAFKPDSIGDDIDAYLTKAESTVGDIKPGAQKQMIWADPTAKRKTPFSIVYLHGFSASLQEIRPVPDNVAKAYNANLFYTRFTGHGRNGDAMAEGKLNAWMNDLAQAMAIGRATGEKIIIIATSTGGTLATIAATKPALMKNVAGMVMISPNYAVQAAGAEVLSLPWARQILPKIFGEQREWQPKNEQQRQWWSTRYPNVALLPMQASVNTAADVAYEDLAVPALFMFHEDDGVVKSSVTETVAARWGKNSDTPATVHRVLQSDDSFKHVIAGDILDPANTEPVTQRIIEWINTL